MVMKKVTMMRSSVVDVKKIKQIISNLINKILSVQLYFQKIADFTIHSSPDETLIEIVYRYLSSIHVQCYTLH